MLLRVLYSKFKIKKGSLGNKKTMKTQKQGFAFKIYYCMNNIITGNIMQADAEQNTCYNIWVHYSFAFYNYQNK